MTSEPCRSGDRDEDLGRQKFPATLRYGTADITTAAITLFQLAE